ncbi:12709_t:CDS:1, partial [Dentiscutata heterogama]
MSDFLANELASALCSATFVLSDSELVVAICFWGGVSTFIMS